MGDAAVIGGAVGCVIVFRKDIKKLFSAAGKAVCNHQINKRFTNMQKNIKERSDAKVYAFKKSLKSLTRQARSCVRGTAKKQKYLDREL